MCETERERETREKVHLSDTCVKQRERETRENVHTTWGESGGKTVRQTECVGIHRVSTTLTMIPVVLYTVLEPWTPLSRTNWLFVAVYMNTK